MKSSLLLLCLIISGRIFAQNSISGQVNDPQGKPLVGATISLWNLLDSLSRLVGQNGAFNFAGVPKGSYMLKISHIGFLPYQNSVLVDGNVQLPLIVLRSEAKVLGTVIITSKKPLVEQQIDRTIVNIDAMISATSGNALDVLAKSPGVIIASNDDITLNGKNNVLVLIDDRPTYMTGQTLAAYLRSLPGGMLDKLELISNPTARYDANGNAVINIVLKKNQTAGFNGALSLGYNQGVYARSNDALNVNYRTPKFNLFSNIGYNHDQNFSDQAYSRYFFNSTILQTSRSTYNSNAFNGRVGMDYFVSPKTTIGIMLTGSTRPKTDLFNYNSSQYNSLMQLNSTGRGFISGNYSTQNYGFNLNLQHKFDQASKVLSVNMDQLNYLNGSEQPSLAEVYLPNGNLFNSQVRRFIAPSNIHIYAGKVDYTLPMADKAEFSAGVKSSYVNTDNQSNWFNNSLIDYRRSDHFSYHENINSAYVNVKKDWKRWAVQAGLRLEQTNADGYQFGNPANLDSTFTKHYTNLFPSLYLLHKLDNSGNNTLVLSFSRRLRRPSYQQLNPFLFFQDQYTYNGGNTGLIPSFNQYAELKYS